MTGEIAQAVSSADGVLAIAGGRSKGIKISNAGKERIIDVNVVLKFGTRIPETAWQLQQTVRNAVVNIGEPEPSEININIRGIRES